MIRIRAWQFATAVVTALLWVSPAYAFPVVFNGPSGFGVSQASADAAEAAGIRIITGSSVAPADSIPFSVPAPDVLTSHIVSNPSVANPNTAQSRWTVTNAGDSFLDDAWLVFLTPASTDYTKSKVGIDLQLGGAWALVELPSAGTNYFYPAVFLGDMESDAASQFLMNHVVGEALTQQGNMLILPKYQIGVFTGVPLPEPAGLVILAASTALVGALRRRKV